MRGSLRGRLWLLVAVVVALIFAMAFTLIGLSKGSLRSRHGVHGAAPFSSTPHRTV